MSQFSPNLSSGHPTNKTGYHYKGPDNDSQCHGSHQTCHQDILQIKQNITTTGPDNNSQCHSCHQTCHQDVLQIKQNITTRDLTMTVNVTVLTNLSSGHPTNKTEYQYKGPDNDSQCHGSHQTCHQDILQIKQNITTRDLTMTVNVTVLIKLVIRTSYKQNRISLQGT